MNMLVYLEVVFVNQQQAFIGKFFATGEGISKM
jgi:hypothetical protein